MEAACESARHAVNAILDHYVWVESGGVGPSRQDDARLADSRMASSTRACRLRFECRHRQATTATSSTSRTGSRSTPARCATSTRNYHDCGIPATPSPRMSRRSPMTTPIDYNQQLLSYLQAWRQLLEASAAHDIRAALPAEPMGMPPMPPMPFMPPMHATWHRSPRDEPADRLRAAVVRLPAGVAAVPRAGDRRGRPSLADGRPRSDPAGAADGSEPTVRSQLQAQSTGPQAGGTRSGRLAVIRFGVRLRTRTKTGLCLRPRRSRRDDHRTSSPQTDWGASSARESPQWPKSTIRAIQLRPCADQRSTPERVAVTSGSSTRSLYGRSSPVAGAQRRRRRSQAGQDPRRAAPPATSRWWEAGEGRGQGSTSKPDPTNLLNIRPTDLGGRAIAGQLSLRTALAVGRDVLTVAAVAGVAELARSVAGQVN